MGRGQQSSASENGQRMNSEHKFHLVYAVALLLSVLLNIIFLSREGPITSILLPHFDHREYFSPVKKSPRHLDEAFGACLLVKDDNHRLTEWLAYHFHVLPLDYLVIGVDPNSRTSPTPILDRWRDYGMTIVEWNDEDIFQGWLTGHHRTIVNAPEQLPSHHRQRQNLFLRNCLVHMKQANRTWVILTDSDEYLVFNGPPGSINNYAHIPYPSVKKEGSVLSFLHKERKRPKSNLTAPCISVPRMLFGTVESTEAELQTKVPSGFDSRVLDTMRYRKHLRRHVTFHHKLNGWAKTLIDVSRIKMYDIPTPADAAKTMPYIMNVHQPLPKVCPLPYIKDGETLFRINHYVGSWEAFSYRQDSRESEGRGKEKWYDKAHREDENDDNIREWLGGFAEEHGTAKASKMLHGAGVFTKLET